MDKIATITTHYGETDVHAGRYQQGGGICIRLSTLAEEGYMEPLLTLTANAPGASTLAHGEFIAKDWSENAPFIKDILSSGVFEDTGRKVSMGMTMAPIWRFKNAEHVPEPIPSRRTRKAA